VKFRFEDQPHQAAAIKAVTDLFEGAVTPPAGVILGTAAGAAGHGGFRLDNEALAERLVEVTGKDSSIERQTSLELLEIEDLQGGNRSFPNFSVEMETGTGKTYVYIGTALHLAQTHGFRKFVILVHSVAIRAGVVKTFQQTEDHFRAKFPALQFQWGVLGEGPALDDLLEPSSTVRFLVVSVQSIDKPDTGIVYQEAEQPQLWGESGSGMASIAAMRPIVILDEPQNFKTDLRKRAIATLNPLVVLRYSATHAEKFNLVHRLGPKAATELGLVKRVSVKGIAPGASGQAYIRVDKLRSKSRRLFAEVTIDVSTSGGARRNQVVLQNGDDLYAASNGLEQYRGLVIDRFERKPDRIVFDSGAEMHVGEETGVDRMSIWEDQLRHTIRAHLQRQTQLDGSGYDVKVLSLFFVERVADYWAPEGEAQPVLPGMFDRLYREEWVKAGKPEADCPDPSTLRVHYFPSTKTGIFKDAIGGSKDAQEFQSRAYEEIVANKELILVKENPRAFIFSHSALREGWDNPNVFQVGFLRHSGSEVERRQQIGRGLRLPVEQSGKRVTDQTVCRLTLVVDETFRDFRDGLNKEFAAAGSNGGSEPDDADHTVVVRRRIEKFLSEEFKDLWSRIRYKARYKVDLHPEALPKAVAVSEHLEEIKYISKRANVVQSAELTYDDMGRVITADSAVAQSTGTHIRMVGQRLPDLVRLLEDQLLSSRFPLQLTRPTIAAIIGAIPPSLQSRALGDPARWTRIVAAAIRVVTIEEMVKHIVYEPLAETDWWEADVVFLDVEEVTSPSVRLDEDPSSGVAEAPVGGKNLFTHTIYDSHVERNFAALLENFGEAVKLFTKLPRRFKVRTPVGEYSPDWAIVFAQNGNEHLYLVRETKATLNLDDLEWDEAMRIRFARRHFCAAPSGAVDFQFTSDKEGIRVMES
jgi:type III restriction enzyme